MCIQKEENEIPFVKIKKNAWKIQVGLGCKDFPAGSDSKESTCNAGDQIQSLGLQRSLAPWDLTESDMTE